MSTAQLSDQQVIELGASLREARETQGRDLSESAFRIALSPSQLRALESGDRRPFYSTHYFLQAAERYAAFLGMALPEYISRRPETPPLKAADNTAMEEAVVGDMDGDMPPVDQRGFAASHATTTPPPAAVLPSGAKPVSGKRPSTAVLAIAAAIIVVASVALTLNDGTPTAPSAANTQAASAISTSAPAGEYSAPAVAAQAAPLPAQQQPATAQAATAPLPTPPATPPAPVAATPAIQVSAPKPAAVSGGKDGRIESTVNAWVQVVSKSGEKSNLRVGAGESVEFVSSETAAVVIGQPEKATLTVRGKAVDLRQYASSKDGSPRALVIIGDIRN